MRKLTLILAMTLFLVSLVVSTEAANRLQAIRSAVPKVMDATTKSLTKVGDGITSFFWRNKGAITTGAVLVTAISNPEPFIDGAVAIAAGPPTVIVQNADGGPVVVPDVKKVAKRSRSASDGIGYTILIGLLGVVGLVIMYEIGGRTRTIAKVVTVVLLIGVVLLFCNVVRADDFSTVFESTCVAWPWGWRFWGDRMIDLVLVLVLLLFPLG